MRSLFILLILIIPAIAFAQPCTTTSAGGCDCKDGSNECDLLPDMMIARPLLEDPSNNPESPGELGVSVSTPNIGHGPLRIIATDYYVCDGDTTYSPGGFSGTCPDGSDPLQLIQQRIYHKNNSTMTYYDRPAGTMTYHPTHGHMHVDDWGVYTIREEVPGTDPLSWPIVGTGAKLGFCLMDFGNCLSYYGHCEDTAGNIISSDAPNLGLGGGTYSCGLTNQGISAGYTDIYYYYLDGMQVVIPPGTCNGDYKVVVHLDPYNYFLEEDESNNVIVTDITLTEQADCGGTCEDGIQNGSELGIDCGGAACPACGTDVCLTGYCVSYGSNTSDEWIESVNIGPLSNTSGNNGGYNDFGDAFGLDLEKDGNYSFSLTPGYSGTIYNEYWKIWIDYNRNGSFNDAGEMVYDAGSASNTTMSGSFTVPMAAVNGKSRMRVQMKYDVGGNECETYTWGEVEDYCVNLVDPGAGGCTTPTNLTVSAIGTTSVTLNWDPVDNSDGYQIKGRLVGSSGLASTTTFSTSKTVGSLSPGTSYEWKIRARCLSGDISDFSPYNTFTTNTLRESMLNEQMEVYPNPNDGNFQLRYEGISKENVLVEVINSLGQLIWSSQITSGEIMTVKLDESAAGLYFIRLEGTEGVIMERIVVE